jgi:BirA family transcriptional regulator, biotin operon repressor / biotin---[acetyl-CoA-carboxylase] ligase
MTWKTRSHPVANNSSGDGLRKFKVFKKLIYKSVTGSTNDDASRMIRKETFDAHGTIIAARYQTAGKGRAGRKWISPSDSGITASFILKNPFSPKKNFLSTIAASVAVCGFLEKTRFLRRRHLRGRFKRHLRPRIKWPNDILVEGRKIAGILVENEAGMTVIGIGLNLNADFSSHQELADIATSVFMVTGKKSDNRKQLMGLASHLERVWRRCLRSPESVFRDWKRKLLIPREPVHLSSDGSNYYGKITGVRPDGGLKLRTYNGILTLYNCDSVHPEN